MCLAAVVCSTGFVDRGVWLRIAKQCLSCALVRGCGVVFRHYYKSIAKCAKKDGRDGAVTIRVSVDTLCALLDCTLGFFPCYFLLGCKKTQCSMRMRYEKTSMRV